MEIQVLTWSEVLSAAKWRYRFFAEKLQYQIESEDGADAVKEKYKTLFQNEDSRAEAILHQDGSAPASAR